jgi:ElaB/YqjD/DUF883 family membrane-anchored ribosome-binding protein
MMDTQTATNGRLADGLRHMVEEAEQRLHGAAESGDRKLDAMRVKFQHQLERMRLQLDEMEQATGNKARQAARAADRTVHAHPYGAIGLAAAVGALVGFLAARRG